MTDVPVISSKRCLLCGGVLHEDESECPWVAAQRLEKKRQELREGHQKLMNTTMTTDEMIGLIIRRNPNHLNISFNEQWVCYRTVSDEIESQDAPYTDDAFMSAEDRRRCMDTNTLWTVQYYPNTPVGFVFSCGSTRELALQRMVEILELVPAEINNQDTGYTTDHLFSEEELKLKR